jgi:hypothetical protein
VLAAALVGAACGDGDGGGGGDDAGPVATSPAPVSSGTDDGPTDPATTVTDGTTGAPAGTVGGTADVAVPELLQFTAPLVGGGEFDGASVAGTTTLFWFWAPF